MDGEGVKAIWAIRTNSWCMCIFLLRNIFSSVESNSSYFNELLIYIFLRFLAKTVHQNELVGFLFWFYGISTFCRLFNAKFIFIQIISSILNNPTSCCGASTDIPDLLSPLLPIVHRYWQVFRATSRILT